MMERTVRSENGGSKLASAIQRGITGKFIYRVFARCLAIWRSRRTSASDSRKGKEGDGD